MYIEMKWVLAAIFVAQLIFLLIDASLPRKSYNLEGGYNTKKMYWVMATLITVLMIFLVIIGIVQVRL
jgi:hypothetical protein